MKVFAINKEHTYEKTCFTPSLQELIEAIFPSRNLTWTHLPAQPYKFVGSLGLLHSHLLLEDKTQLAVTTCSKCAAAWRQIHSTFVVCEVYVLIQSYRATVPLTHGLSKDTLSFYEGTLYVKWWLVKSYTAHETIHPITVNVTSKNENSQVPRVQ